MTFIDNPLGSAPGLLWERDGRVLAALPGVPAEMKAMFDASVAPRLSAYARGALARTTLRIAGRPESYVDDLVRDLYGSEGTETTILASSGSVELLLTARGADASDAKARLAAVAGAMRGRLGVDVYGADEESLAGVVLRLLSARGATLGLAESCTGGLLGATLTDVPGSSVSFRGGVVCYANDLRAVSRGPRSHDAKARRGQRIGGQGTSPKEFGLADFDSASGRRRTDGGTKARPVARFTSPGGRRNAGP
jgi:nicotinamide-nucleotide amidase